MDDIWQDALRYNRWANVKLLDSCATLKPAQLELTSPGTYGTIAATFAHIVGAEQRYLRRLAGTTPTFSEKAPFPGIAALRELARHSGDELLAAAGRLQPDDVTQVDFDGEMAQMRKSLIVVQAIHHGNDHRTHICTILGSHSVPFDDIQVWSYALELHKGAAV